MTNTLVDKIIFAVGTALFISDLLFPLWLFGIIFYLRRKKWKMWKAWGVASTFCLSQAYFVAKTVGYNVGAYTLTWFGSRPSTLFYDLPPHTSITKYLTPFQLNLVYWVTPPITIIILPTLMLFMVSKLMKRSELIGSTYKPLS